MKERMRTGLKIVWLVGAVCLLAGCGLPGRPSAGVSTPSFPSISPSQMATATSTPPPLPSPTLTATPTPPPTQTPSPTPTLAPLVLKRGPLLVYPGNASEMRLVWSAGGSSPFIAGWGLEDGSNWRTETVSAPAQDGEQPDQMVSFDFKGLEAGRLYRYELRSGQAALEGSFRAAPAADAPLLRFFNYGDSRAGVEAQDAVAAGILEQLEVDPDWQTLLLHSGDFATYGDEPQSWAEEFFTPRAPHVQEMLRRLPLLPAIGNHEGGGQLFLSYFPLPWVRGRYGSFDYGPVHFVLLDQYVNLTPESNQVRWLEEDLASTERKWVIVMIHEPGWSAGSHPNNPDSQALQPLFEQYGVRLVLTGHNHYYARAEVNGVTWLTVGTGGSPLYDPIPGSQHVVFTHKGYGFAMFELADGNLTGRFLDPEGVEIDRFVIAGGQ